MKDVEEGRVHTRETCDGVYTSDGGKEKELSEKRKRKKKKKKRIETYCPRNSLKNNLEFFRVIRFF